MRHDDVGRAEHTLKRPDRRFHNRLVGRRADIFHHAHLERHMLCREV